MRPGCGAPALKEALGALELADSGPGAQEQPWPRPAQGLGLPTAFSPSSAGGGGPASPGKSRKIKATRSPGGPPGPRSCSLSTSEFLGPRRHASRPDHPSRPVYYFLFVLRLNKAKLDV